MLDLVFWGVAFFAALLGTIAAFGISSILLPVALLFFEFRTALALVSIFHLAGNIGRITFFRSGVDLRFIIKFGVPSVVFTFLGASLVTFVSQPVLRFVLGLVLMGYTFLSLFNPTLTLTPNRVNSVVGGAVYGFFAGLIGTGGPIRGAILSAFRFKKSTYIATSGTISFFVDLTRVPLYLIGGFLTPPYYGHVPLLFLVALTGAYTSTRLVTRITTTIFRVMIQCAIALISLKLVYDGIQALV